MINQADIQGWWNKAIGAVRMAPAKASFLGVMTIILGILCARLMMGGNAGPQIAAASSTGASALSRAVHENTSHDWQKALDEWLASPVQPLRRDLFVIKLDYYPQDGKRIHQVLQAPQGDGFWDQLAKSMVAKADQKKERRILIENLRLQAAQLKLQTTLMGRHPRAMVNGEMIGEGDKVASFRVLKIEPRRMIVERKGIQLTVEMQ